MSVLLSNLIITLVPHREELEEAFRLFDREGDGQIETQVLAAIHFKE